MANPHAFRNKIRKVNISDSLEKFWEIYTGVFEMRAQILKIFKKFCQKIK
jgi:hypothetical protein